MKKLILIALLLLSYNAQAATAFWTGQMEYVQTISYQQGINCQYNANGQYFWQVFTTFSCPYSIEVY